MSNILGELEEYIVVGASSEMLVDVASTSSGNTSRPEVIVCTPNLTAGPHEPKSGVSGDYKWSQNETKILIDLYSKYKKRTGTMEIKNAKMMWQRIAQELGKLKIIVTPNNCMNRWKVLERNYKKFVDNKTKTGRGRKYFEYEAEMDEILGKKRNVNPELLLDSDTIVHNLDIEENVEGDSDIKNKENISVQHTPVNKIPPTNTPKNIRTNIMKKKTTTIEKIRLDRKTYYEERLKIEREKLEEIKKRNAILLERNDILKNKNCHCHNL